MTLQQVFSQLLTPFLAPGGAASAPLDDAARTRLLAMGSDAGELIFTGSVVPEGSDSGLYRYQRRTQRSGERRVSTHVTFPLDSDEPVLAQRAVHSPSFDLVHFEEIHGQTGAVSSVDVSTDGTLEFALDRGATSRRRTEGPGAPVIVAPTLFGFVLERWDDLMRGDAIAVRFAATEYARSYPFSLRLHATDEGTTTIAFEAADFFVRLALERMLLVFDTTTRTIVQYTGRVPPRLPDMRTFDARVEYDHAVTQYR